MKKESFGNSRKYLGQKNIYKDLDELKRIYMYI